MTEEEIKSEQSQESQTSEPKEAGSTEENGQPDQETSQQSETSAEGQSEEVKEEEEEEPEEMVEVPKSRYEELVNAEEIALENLKRERAESINYRKRLQRQRDEFAELASVRVLTKVLAVKDDLKRVVDNSNNEIPETHMEGIQLVQQRLEGIFNQEGVELIKINEGDTKYDPKFMEAVVSQPMPNVEPNTVIGVISQGFKKGDRVLRAAKVMISKAPEEKKTKEENQESSDESSKSSSDIPTEESSTQTQEAATGDAPDQKGNSGNGEN